jgi:serine/threonine protein phosphatase PrpC
MGAAFVAIHAKSGGLCLGHAGHCRAYRLREGRFSALTEDHRALNAYLWRGVPLDVAERRPDKDALVRALGLKECVEITSRVEDARAGDVVLLCSNGVSDVIPEVQIAAMLAGRSELGATADALIASAQARGAPDDVTCLVLRWTTSVDARKNSSGCVNRVAVVDDPARYNLGVGEVERPSPRGPCSESPRPSLRVAEVDPPSRRGRSSGSPR